MPRNRLIAVTLFIALFLLIVPLTVSATAGVADDKSAPPVVETLGPNLLSNPGLEGHYQQQCSLKTEAPWVPAPTPCDPTNYDFVNRTLWATAQVPVGWAAWWRVPNSNYDDPNYYNSFPNTCESSKKSVPAGCVPYHNPEFRDTLGGPQETGPARRMEGENSQKYFTFYTVHDAGLYQIVANGVKKGDLLRFSVYMMAWSSTENDSFKSVGQRSMGMQVGIDPYGGNNPWSSNIVWAPVQESWDKFSQFTVEAVAQGTMVSVWTRSQPVYAIQHNDVYVDAASLNVVAGKITPRTTTVKPALTKPITGTKATTPVTGTKTTTPVTGTLPMPASGKYTVARGDTLIAIARRFGIIPWRKLIELNDLQEPYKLEVGQVLKLK